jgi:hypothetical protein
MILRATSAESFSPPMRSEMSTFAGSSRLSVQHTHFAKGEGPSGGFDLARHPLPAAVPLRCGEHRIQQTREALIHLALA